MHAILCAFFISVNKLMLASFIHSYEVYETDFLTVFLHCFLSVFIKSLDIGPSCVLFYVLTALVIAVKCFICAFTNVRSLF